MKHSPLEHVLAEDWRHGGFGIYIHWPFCQSKCPYCDFNSHVASSVDQAAWCSAYLNELDRHAKDTGDRFIDSVFLGGGTPSLMSPETVAAILDRIRKNWRPRNAWEVTLEANPTSVEAGRFAGYCDAGVNRVSIGVQSLTDSGLRDLGRLHSVAEAVNAVSLARAIFPRVSLDLIYARQGQTEGAWQQELATAIALGTDHLSLYQLTIEPGTAFHSRQQAGGLQGLPSEDRSADLYELTQRVCENAGLPAYEVSNHARADAQSIHNNIYWRAGDYLGIGPGAHGRLTLNGTRWATTATSAPTLWLDTVRSGRAPETSAQLTPAEQVDEYLLMGLRLRDGVSLRRLEAMLQRTVDRRLFGHLVDLGLVSVDDVGLRTTESGRLVLNAIITSVSSALS